MPSNRFPINKPWTIYRNGKVLDCNRRAIAQFFNVAAGEHAVASVNGEDEIVAQPDPEQCPPELRVALAEWARAEDSNLPIKDVRALALRLAREWISKDPVTR